MDEPALRDISGLAALAGMDAAAARPVLLRVKADLFLSAPSHSRDELAAFAALACGLIPLVDIDTRALVARKLAGHPATPEAVLEALFRSGAGAAVAVVAQRPALPQAWREELLAGRDRHLLAALAGRPDVPAATLRDLAACEEPLVDLAIAGNVSLVLPDDVLAQLVSRARERGELARALLARRDIPALDAAALLPFAEPAQRPAILKRLAEEARLAPARGRPAGSDAAKALLAHAAKGDRAMFGAALAVALGLDVHDVARILTDQTGELLALTLIVAGLSPEEAVRVFLTLDPAIGRSVTTVFTLSVRVRTTDAATARLALEACLGATIGHGPSRTGTHQPAMDPSGTPARGAVTAEHPATGEDARTSRLA